VDYLRVEVVGRLSTGRTSNQDHWLPQDRGFSFKHNSRRGTSYVQCGVGIP
jgi:hypothetical protein